jgi:hypothetical protein
MAQQTKTHIFLLLCILHCPVSIHRARSTVVVKALGGKPEEIYLILAAALGPGVYSASNRNEYQKQKNNVCRGVKCGRCVRLTILLPSVS